VVRAEAITLEDMEKRVQRFSIPNRADEIAYGEACLNGMFSAFPMISVGDKDAACRAFVKKLTHNYGKRGQGVKETENEKQRRLYIERQHRVGKLAEFVAYRTLKDVFVKLTPPDLRIYQSKQKSFDWDMKCKPYNFAVKGCDHAGQWPISWMFQHRDSEGYGCDTHIFKRTPTANEYVVFVVMDMENLTGRIAALVPLEVMLDADVFEPPISKSLINYKVVIYWDTLIAKKLAPTQSKRIKWIVDAVGEKNGKEG